MNYSNKIDFQSKADHARMTLPLTRWTSYSNLT